MFKVSLRLYIRYLAKPNNGFLKFIKPPLVFLFFVYSHGIFSQSIEINGKVLSSVDVENIHVINKTAKRFTITDKNGVFTIIVKMGDTLTFSSIQHKPKDVVVGPTILTYKSIVVTLEEQINQLSEVVVGKILTGDLLLDIGNAENDAPINFYDVGIPGYKGKIATQSERRYDQANGAGLNYKTLIFQTLSGSIQIDPIVNGISGRTKMLKTHVIIEANANLLRKIKAKFTEDFFSVYPLNENQQMDFFYFCEEDESFSNRCKGKSDIEIWKFLKEKYEAYLNNLSENKD